MCADARGEAEVAEDATSSTPSWWKDSPRAHSSIGSSPTRWRITERIVDAERPERVLVLADLPEVLPVAVDVEDVAELAGLDQLLELRTAGW